MIRYALRCDKGHEFESWFQNSAAYDSQRKRKLVTCPTCESAAVEKAIMAPRIVSKSRSRAMPAPLPAAASEATPSPETTSSEAASSGAASPDAMTLVSPQEHELRAKLKELRDLIVSKAENVGDKFPDEARRMHYGDIEHRPIYGEASLDEARSLIDEGVEVAPLPVVPGDRN